VKRTLTIAAVTLVVAFVAGVMFLIPPTVPPEVIERSVIHEQTLLEKSWLLPTASAFGHYVAYQSNQSLCGPASIANILRSFGEPADTEKKVLAHTTKCWSGICFFGLSLDELADVTRTATKRSVTVLRDLTPEAFRDELTHVNDPSRRYVINFEPNQPILLPLVVRCPAAGSHGDILGGGVEPTIQVHLDTLGGQIYLMPMSVRAGPGHVGGPHELATRC